MIICSILMNILVVPIFCCNQMGILSVDLNNISLGDTNHDEDDSETIIHIRILPRHITSEKCKAIKKV